MQPTGHRQWTVAPPAPASLFAALPDVHPAVVQVLCNRGLRSSADVREFLASGQAPLSDPFALPDMQAAVVRLRQAAVRGERVAVHGDYDVDGVTGAAVLTEALQMAGLDVVPFLPRRDIEGYGIHPRTVDALAAQGCRLMVTADTGVSAVREVELAAASGLDVIVTDHHAISGPLPPACAVINPQRADTVVPSGAVHLAGVGVAFKLAQALELAGVCSGPSACTECVLDLVALGTIADVAPLLGENRTLVHRGLARHQTAPRPGIRALSDRAGVPVEALSGESLAFVIAPRLNAAGRLADPHLAFELLLTADLERARYLAAEVDRLNTRRQQLTDLLVREAQEQVARLDRGLPALVVTGERWPLGIIGLVATRLAETHGRPVFVIGVDGADGRGSARGPRGFDLMAMLDACKDILRQHGGHAGAAGFALDAARVPELAERLAAAGDRLSVEAAPAQADLELDWTTMHRQPTEAWVLHRALEALAPFGQGNPAPTFLSRGLIVRDCRRAGGRHARLRLACGGQVVGAFGPNLGDRLHALARGSRVDAVYNMGITRWDGQESLEFRLHDAWTSP